MRGVREIPDATHRAGYSTFLRAVILVVAEEEWGA
jgi:hypothetical protein